MQWVGGPNWSRHHDHMASLSAMVSAGGRVFYIMDEGPRESILLPSQWSLIARDAFNGTLLWKRPIAEWNTQLWPLKSGPNQLPRRLVAVGDRVYVTLGIDAPLDGARRRHRQDASHLRRHASTPTKCSPPTARCSCWWPTAPNKWKDYRPKHTYVWDNTQAGQQRVGLGPGRAARSWPCEADSGAACSGSKRRTRGPADPGRRRATASYFYDGEKVVALDRADGRAAVDLRAGRSASCPSPPATARRSWSQQGVVLLSIENKYDDRLLRRRRQDALDGPAPSRRARVARRHAGGRRPGLVGATWPTAPNSGMFTGRDLHTGEVKSEFPPDVNPPLVPPPLLPQPGDRQVLHRLAHRHRVHRPGGQALGHQPLGPRRLPLRVHAGQRPDLRAAALLRLLPGVEAVRLQRPGRRSRPAAQVPREVPEDGPAASAARPTIVAVASRRSPAAAADDWPTYRHDAARSGSVEDRRAGRAEAGLAGRPGRQARAASWWPAARSSWPRSTPTRSMPSTPTRASPPGATRPAGGSIRRPRSTRAACCSARPTAGSTASARPTASSSGGSAPRRSTAGWWPTSSSSRPGRSPAACWSRTARCTAWPAARPSSTAACGWCGSIRRPAEALRDGPRRPRSRDRREPAGADAGPGHAGGPARHPLLRRPFDLHAGPGVRSGRQAPRRSAPVKLGRAQRQRPTARRRRRSRPTIGDHLFSRSGFLDDSWFWRSYWIYGKAVDSNYGGWLQPGPLRSLRPADGLRRQRRLRLRPQARVSLQRLGAGVLPLRADREVTEEAIQRVQRGHAAGSTRPRPTRAPPRPTGRCARSSRSPTRTPATSSGPRAIRRSRPAAWSWPATPCSWPVRPTWSTRRRPCKNPDDPAIRAKLDAQAAALAGPEGRQTPGRLGRRRQDAGRLRTRRDAHLRRHGRRRRQAVPHHGRRQASSAWAVKARRWPRRRRSSWNRST